MTTALERIHGADTRLTTSQRIAQQVVRAGVILGLSGVGICGIGAISRIPSLQLVGAIIAPGSLIIAAGASAASSEIGEKLDAAEILRLDASEQRAKAYREGLEAGLEQGEASCKALLAGRFTEGFREGERSAAIALQGQSDMAKNQALAQSQATIDALQGELSRARGELRSSQDEVARLGQAIAEKDKEIAQLSQLRKRVAAIKQRENEAAERIEIARQTELDIERAKAELAREHGALFGDFEATKMIAQQSQNEVLRLENLIQELQQSHEQDLKDTQASAYQAGFNQALGESEQVNAILSAKVAELESRLGRIKDDERMDKVTPDLKSILSKRGIQPLICVGSQGSGKAMVAMAAADILRGDGNVIPFVLDVSEGADPHSSWRKNGIPVTADPRVFLQFLRAIKSLVDGGQLAHRNDRENFASQPLILPIIDEAMTALDALSKDEIAEVADILTILETRGAKRKVMPVMLSIDDQIQNLKTKGVAIVNQGRLRNYCFVVLNQKVRIVAPTEHLKYNGKLQEYLHHHEHRYIAAIQEWDARGAIWVGIKHPTHYGNLLVDSMPKLLPNPSLAPCPAWLPSAVRIEYLAAAPNSPEQAPNKTNEQPNTPRGTGLRLLPGGTGDTPVLGDGDTNERHERIIALASQGVSATAIAEQISGRKKGGSKAFLAAKDEVLIVLNKGDE